MNDEELLHRITSLVDEEHALLNAEAQGDNVDPDNTRMKELEVMLDQAWDLLRQRRARRDFGGNPDEAEERPADVVENYRQ